MNTFRPPGLEDAYEARRADVEAEQTSDDWLENLIVEHGTPPPTAAPEGEGKGGEAPMPVVPSVDVSEQPSDIAVQQAVEEETGLLGHVMNTVEWVTSPLMALGDAAIAPIAHEYESEGFLEQGVEAFKVAGEAAMNRLAPDYGQENEDYGAVIADRVMPNAPDSVKGAVGTTISMLSDPSLAVGLPTVKVVQKGLQAARQTGNANIVEEGLHELLTFGKGIDPTELSDIGILAQKADQGDVEALKQLSEQIDENPAIMSAVQLADDADVMEQLSKADIAMGNPNAADFIIDDSIDPAKVLIKNTVNSNTPARAGNLNLSRLNTEEDVDTLLMNMEELFEADFKKAAGRQSNSATMQLAQQEQLKELIGRDVATFTTAKSYALRQTLVVSGKQLTNLAKRASLPGASKLDELAFEKGLAVHRAIQSKAAGVAGHAGRLLQSYNMIAREGRGRLKEVNDLIAGLGSTRQSQKIMKQMLAAVDDPQAINRIANKTMFAKTSDAMFEVFVNAILSGPTTHLINMTSNAYLTALSPTQNVLEGLSAVTRLDFQKASSDFGEGIAKFNAIASTTGDALMTMGTFGIKKFDSPEALRQTHEIAQQTIKPAISSAEFGATGTLGKVIDAVGTTARLPGNVLLKEDKFFKTMHYRMEVNAAASRKAAAYGNSRADKRILYNRLQGNPDEGTIANAIDQAAINTFTNQLGDTASALHKGLMKVPGVRYMLPFFRTPTNIVKMGIRNSAVGNVFKDLQPALTGTGAKADTARAKIAMGTAIPVAMMMYMDENVTGRIDQKTATGRFKASQGAPPYSIKIGKKWVSYERIEPLRSVLGLYVNAKETLETVFEQNEANGEINEVGQQIIGAVVGATISTVGDNYMLPFLGDMTFMLKSLASGNPEYATKKMSKLVASAVPYSNFTKQTKRALGDGTYMQAETLLDQIRVSTPGLSPDLPNVKTFWGDDQILPNGVGFDIVNPIKTVDRVIDEVDQTMINLGVSISRQPKTITFSGIELELDPFQQARFMEVRGKGPDGESPLKEDLREMFSDPSFQALPPNMQLAQTQRIVNRVTESAKKFLMNSDPNLQFQFEQAVADKEEAMRILQ